MEAARLPCLRLRPEPQQALYAARPAWPWRQPSSPSSAGRRAVLGLLLGRKWAFPVLVLSLVGILVQDYGLFVLIDGLGGSFPVVMQTLVLLIGIGLVLLGRKGVARGWLR